MKKNHVWVIERNDCFGWHPTQHILPSRKSARRLITWVAIKVDDGPRIKYRIRKYVAS